jgi:hypothetical protein
LVNCEKWMKRFLPKENLLVLHALGLRRIHQKKTVLIKKNLQEKKRKKKLSSIQSQRRHGKLWAKIYCQQKSNLCIGSPAYGLYLPPEVRKPWDFSALGLETKPKFQWETDATQIKLKPNNN